MSSLLLPWLYTLIPLLFFTILALKWLSSSTTKTPTPPSPWKLPIIGNLHQLGLLPHRSLHALSKKYGPLMLLHFGRSPMLVVSSAAAAREIMKTNDLIFSNRPKSTVARRLLYDEKDVAFSPYGEYWREIRSICVLQLLSNKKVQSFCAVREEETTLLIKKMKDAFSSNSAVNLSELFVSFTYDVVCRVALGKKYNGKVEGTKFTKLIGEFGELLGAFYVGDYIPWLGWLTRINGLDAKLDRVAKSLDEFFEVVVEEHMGGQNLEKNEDNEMTKDFVDILLEYQKENKISSNLSRDSIKAIVLDVFAAGTDTTFAALEWTMTELIRHPRVMKKLQNEVRENNEGKMLILENDLEKMHYLKAVMKESLRLHPPVPLLVPRESTKEAKVMGYKIAAKTQVIINYWTIGRDPLLWEDADTFMPERFMNTSIDLKGHDFELIPFGAGRRGCPGTLFAMSANELALANLVYHFNFELPCGGEVEDLGTDETSGLTIHLKNSLQVIATPYSF